MPSRSSHQGGQESGPSKGAAPGGTVQAPRYGLPGTGGVAAVVRSPQQQQDCQPGHQEHHILDNARIHRLAECHLPSTPVKLFQTSPDGTCFQAATMKKPFSALSRPANPEEHRAHVLCTQQFLEDPSAEKSQHPPLAHPSSCQHQQTKHESCLRVSVPAAQVPVQHRSMRLVTEEEGEDKEDYT